MASDPWRPLRLFWDGVGHVGRVRLLVDLAWAAASGGMTGWLAYVRFDWFWAWISAIGVFVLVAISLFALEVRHTLRQPVGSTSYRERARHPMSAYYGPLILALVGAACIGGAALWWRTIVVAHQDIEWQFDKEKMYFLGLSKSADEEPWVISFQTSARNISREPILNVDSYIRSDLSNDRRRVLFNIGGTRVEPTDTNGITRDGFFQLSSEPFQSPDPNRSEGMPFSRFRQVFGPFTFIFDYDGKLLCQFWRIVRVNPAGRGHARFHSRVLSARPEADRALWRRHSTSSSAKITIKAKATKHPPATSNNSKPTKLIPSR